jgi:hypothetical protein
MMRVVVTLGVLFIFVIPSPAAQTRFINGVFVSPPGGPPIELIAYADNNAAGDFRLAHGSFEDVPTLHEIAGILVNVPSFRLQFAFVASHEIFRDWRSERRQLSLATSPLNVYAQHVRIADLEKRERIDRLLAAVNASPQNPGYVFVTVESYGYSRHYPIRLTPQDVR